MRILVALLTSVVLAACDSPSPDFAGLAPSEVQVGSSTFSVRFTQDKVEAIRTNSESLSSLNGISVRAAQAMEIASGCEVIPGTFEGDAAVTRAALDCET